MEIVYTVKETAALLKCNVDTVHKLRRAGMLPFMKLGSYKIRHEALLKFLEDYEGKEVNV